MTENNFAARLNAITKAILKAEDQMRALCYGAFAMLEDESLIWDRHVNGGQFRIIGPGGKPLAECSIEDRVAGFKRLPELKALAREAMEKLLDGVPDLGND
jgi:hypothetical protein